MFQLGAPGEQRQIPLGASNSVTPVGMSRHGLKAAVPLGAAGSVALIDLAGERIERFFLFPGGNATGSVFMDERTIIAGNLVDDYVGRFRTDQTDDQITDTVSVAPAPAAIVSDGTLVYVISGNLDDAFAPLGNGIITVVDPATMTVLDTIHSGGTNSQAAAFGPDGLLYVVNTLDFVAAGSVTIIDPATRQIVTTVPGFGPGPGGISIDPSGLAYVSGFFFGTVVWNTVTRQFVRDPSDPVCAKLLAMPGTPCRGASAAVADGDGRLYQTFFGDSFQGLPAAVFVYQPGSFQLSDSLTAGVGPISIEVGVFQN
jgi:DNA-binding beta-propeller fold protein YncE